MHMYIYIYIYVFYLFMYIYIYICICYPGRASRLEWRRGGTAGGASQGAQRPRIARCVFTSTRRVHEICIHVCRTLHLERASVNPGAPARAACRRQRHGHMTWQD